MPKWIKKPIIRVAMQIICWLSKWTNRPLYQLFDLL